jgi:biotin carboxyl carrier protein
MRKFQVTVNGNTYEVDVEEVIGGNVVTPSSAQPVTPSVVAAPVSKEIITSSASIGNVRVEAPMQGKIVGIKVVEGQKVQDGDVVAVLEAMKMENEIIATSAGTIASVNVAIGQAVEAGVLIATIN